MLAYAWCDGRVRAGPFPAVAAVLAAQAALVAAWCAADAWGLAPARLFPRGRSAAARRSLSAEDEDNAQQPAAAASSSSSAGGGLASLVPGLSDALAALSGWRELLSALYSDFGAFLLCSALLVLLGRAGVIHPLLGAVGV